MAPLCFRASWKAACGHTIRRQPVSALPTHSRAYASQTGGRPTFEVFNRQAKWMQKEKAASHVEASRQADYLRDEVALRLSERLLDIKRTFPRALDYGANACNIARILTQPIPDPLVDANGSEPGPEPSGQQTLASRIGHLTAADTSPTLLFRDADLPFNQELAITRHVMSIAEEEGGALAAVTAATAAAAAVAAAESNGEIPSSMTVTAAAAAAAAASAAPFAPASFDLVLSSLSLHWVNDLPAALTQIRQLLKPDCPFLCAMLGGDSLFELRTSLQLAEQERRGGLSPHVSPLADVRDMGGLLQRAGFTMLTVDVDDIVVDYPDTFALMADLQAMGEGNAVLGREMGPLPRDVLLANEAIYREMHGNEDGSIPATFRIIYLIGWHPSDNQPKPLPRGSGQVNLKDILEPSGST